jgi:transposase-like protein
MTTSAGTAAREWSDAEIHRALDLFEAGASVRKISSELGISRHQAEKFVKAAKAQSPKPEAERFPRGSFAMVTPEDGVPRPRSATAYEPPHDFETLQRTRAELKSALDRAVQMGDRASVSTFSLALQRLDKTNDPGSAPESAGVVDFSHLPDWALDLLDLMLRPVKIDDAGAVERDGLTPAEQARWTRYERAFAKVR